MQCKQIADALSAALAKISRNAVRFGDRFPPDTGSCLDYSPGLGGNTFWTTGFWTGLLWLAAQTGGGEDLKDLAVKLGPSFDRRLETGEGIDHDLGMLFLPSRVLEYRLTGSATAREAGLAAAAALTARCNEAGGYIQAWGPFGEGGEAGRTIIDSMMNIPLLFWAHGETGIDDYRMKAIRHARALGRYIIRGDGSSYHTFFFDPLNGQPIGGRTHQGRADGSTWARGQAWGIYGFALAYRWSGERPFLDHARRLAGYFLLHLPDDGMCYWDLDLFKPVEPRDTSAAAIAACGLLELARHLGPDGGEYHAAAKALLDRLIAAYQAPPDREALLADGVADLPRGRGIRECTIYGDYFYLEALARMGGGEIMLPWYV